MAEWLDYQRLIASIYQDLEQNAVVTHDDKIPGRDTGITRQIDVSIRTDLAGHTILVIVQAKHLSRPADVNIVGEFKSVIDDVRASKGVLICSAGFTAPALEYGQRIGIDLCTAYDATSRNWALDLRIPLLWVEPVLDVSLQFELIPTRTNTEAIEVDPDVRTWRVSRDGGKTTNTLAELLSAEWSAPGTPRTLNQQHLLVIPCQNLELLFGESFWCPLASLAYVYTIHLHGWQGTFTFAQCRGILNQGTGVLRGKIGLTDKDIPLQRDPSWQAVDDLVSFEASNPNLMRIERSIPPPENFEFSVPDFDGS